uniref:Matrix metallopeptidase 15 n=1 Tax=Anas platyrhynchos TaxID=8839 RepID=A0A8B9SUV6_ANAPL
MLVFLSQAWLRLYGYLPQSSRQMSTMRSAQIFSAALSEMQKFYGIPVTGVLDEETKMWMKRPRCGVPDQFGVQMKSNMRRKRYALTGRRWSQSHLTFRYSAISTVAVASRTTRRSWAGTTRTRPSAKRLTSWCFLPPASTGDSSPFDGVGGFLAHAYFPGPGMGGDTHFDSDEPWTLENTDVSGNNLFLVAVHELGHSLGLEHSSNPSAIMAPFYQWMDTENFQLPEDDLKGIQQLYWLPQPTKPLPTVTPRRPGRPDQRPPRPRPPGKPERPPKPGSPERPDQYGPDICDGNFDTVAVLRGEMFVFKGRWFWRVRHNRVLDNYPMPIGHFWRGLPGDIDAAYERHDGRFVFFKGDRYWLFREANLEAGYPQPLATYGQGIPYDSIDTAVWWEPTGHTFFFRGDRYWRFNEDTRSVDPGYPKPISVWVGIPPSPKGAFLSSDASSTYFYRGTKYWKFDNERLKTEPGYPKSILRDFMGCQVEITARDGRKQGGDVDVVVQIDEYTRTMSVVMVLVLLVLLLCILGLIYVIVQMQRKGTPRMLLYCKRSLQEWV